LGAKIEKAFPAATVELIKGQKGVFIVKLDGKQLWNKHEMDGEFPNEDKLVSEMKGRLTS
jgi:predicted Rdx family selenoprotein